MRVCRSCYEPVQVRVPPGGGFICKCFKPQENCRREKKRKAAAKRRELKNAFDA